MELNEQHKQIVEAVDRAAERILQFSHAIHDRPELGYQETFASDLIAGTLEAYGFQVERGVAGMPTAFCARKGGPGRPRVAFLAEYDALPEIGHACGHNVIAASALAAGIGLGAVAGSLPGEVLVIGTPAEETDGGKVVMVRAGVFDDIDAALMVHPYSGNYTHSTSLAMDAIQLSFYGRPAHASAAPWEGQNALDALLLTFNSINALRQQMRPDARIHGIITRGGTAPNIIPDHTEARFYIRANDRGYLDELVQKFLACAQAGAGATGTRLEFTNFENSFDNMVNNTLLAERVRDYAVQALGMAPFGHRPDTAGSGDMGNVSQVVPAVHLMIDITGGRPVGVHTREFAEAAGSAGADEALLRSGKALALAGYDLLVDPEFLGAVRAEFKRSTGRA